MPSYSKLVLLSVTILAACTFNSTLPVVYEQLNQEVSQCLTLHAPTHRISILMKLWSCLAHSIRPQAGFPPRYPQLYGRGVKVTWTLSGYPLSLPQPHPSSLVSRNPSSSFWRELPQVDREAGESYRDYINELELPHSQLRPLIYCEWPWVMLCMETVWTRQAHWKLEFILDSLPPVEVNIRFTPCCMSYPYPAQCVLIQSTCNNDLAASWHFKLIHTDWAGKLGSNCTGS